jgi:peptidoglycan/LPS O-acetylase OafA/YrhL
MLSRTLRLQLRPHRCVLWVGTGWYRRLVNVRLLAFYGFISYGLYLIHPLLFRLYNDAAAAFAPVLRADQSFAKCILRLPVVLVIATAVAYFSRTTYEEFFLRMKDRGDARRARDTEAIRPVEGVIGELVPGSQSEIAPSE